MPTEIQLPIRPGHRLYVPPPQQRSESEVVPYLYPLFDHMVTEHGLTLMDSEMQDIINVIHKMEGRP